MPEDDSKAVTVATNFDVLAAEYRRIWPDKPVPATLEDYHRLVKENGQAALCLSGGGIRSASFALGVLQALSRAGLLTRFHYLSTVSGGGYTGALLQRWIHERGNDAEAVMVSLSRPEEPEEIRQLRQHSNFITPRVGLGSNDTWTAISISVRNIVLNWLLFIPLVMLVALLPNLFHDGVASFSDIALDRDYILYLPLGVAGLCIAIATFATVRLLPSYRPETMRLPPEGDPILRRRIVWPLVAWSVIGTLTLACELLGPTLADKGVKPVLSFVLLGHGVDLAVFSLGGMILGLFAGAMTLRGDRSHTFAGNIPVWLVSFLLVGLWIAFGSWLFSMLVTERLAETWEPIVLTVLGPLWMLTGTLLGAIFFVGFRSASGPSVVPDEDREWIARLSAVKIRPMLFWAVLAPSVLLINTMPGVKMPGEELSLTGAVTALAGLVAVLGGRSQESGGVVRSAGQFVLRILPLNAIIAVATFVFIVALLICFGLIESFLAGRLSGLFLKLPAEFSPMVVAHLTIGAFLLLLIAVLGRKISVNRFSLNGLYRNRLARAFLGAARPAATRKPDPFTGFDAADNVRMSTLDPKAGQAAILYPVINVALNVTATENLAWQERKAQPFVFTPLYCGSGMLGGATRPGGYVETALYAGGENDAAMRAGGGVSLATAMSLSGASATPNMGYYSSPATAFLMTLFNVRLGAWLPNPALAPKLGREGLDRGSPRNSIGAILSELGGQTHDRGPNIYLSDGGHFENLALYEMIRRRCRFLLVSDAGADPECTLKALGNAVRKVKIDFNVDIDFPKLRFAKRGADFDGPQTAWALGRVSYPEGGEQGRILYLKPGFFGEGLPADVIAYARGSEAFPHESTTDQFFSESQFESYRRLGDHFLTRLLLTMAVVRNAEGHEGVATLAEFFDAVAEIDKDPGMLQPERWADMGREPNQGC